MPYLFINPITINSVVHFLLNQPLPLKENDEKNAKILFTQKYIAELQYHWERYVKREQAGHGSGKGWIEELEKELSVLIRDAKSIYSLLEPHLQDQLLHYLSAVQTKQFLRRPDDESALFSPVEIKIRVKENTETEVATY